MPLVEHPRHWIVHPGTWEEHPDERRADDGRLLVPPHTLMMSNFELQLYPQDGYERAVTRFPLECRQGRIHFGQIHALRIRIREAAKFGISARDLFQASEEPMRGLYDAIYDVETGEIRGRIADTTVNRDILFIESVKIIPRWRGKRLGLDLVERACELLADGCAAMALKAVPLSEDDETMYPDNIDYDVFSEPFPAAEDEAKSKLRAYWAQLGFERVDETDYMALDPSRDRPTR